MDAPALPQWQPLYHLPTQTQSLLDIGCNIGELLMGANQRGVGQLYGIDINRKAIEKAELRFKEKSSYQFFHGSADSIPLESHSMDAITFCEVLEHVPKNLRSGVFKEIDRLLKPGGTLILTTPYRGFFHWLDPANLRLRFPGLFQFLSRTIGGPGREEGFEGEKHGIVWHHHFTIDELEAIIPANFTIETIRYRGVLLAPLTQYLMFPFYRWEKFSNPIYLAIRKAKELELNWNPPQSLAFNILMTLKKKETQTMKSNHPITLMIHDMNPWGGQDRSMLEIAWQLNKDFPLEIHSYSVQGYNNWPNMTHVEYKSLVRRPIIFKYLSYHLQSQMRLRQRNPSTPLPVQSTGTASLTSDVVQVQFIHHSWEKIKTQLPKDKASQAIWPKRIYHNGLTRFKLALEKSLYNPKKKFIAISHGIKKELMEHFNIPSDNIDIIYHGVDTEEFRPFTDHPQGMETRKKIRQQHGLAESDFVLLHVGALNARKGIFKTLEVIAFLKNQGFENVKLLAVGQGDQTLLKEKIKKLKIQDHVVFASHSKSIRNFYWAADLFFFPSYYEPFGLVILEAMACGVAVATSNTAGAAELIQNRQNGLLFTNEETIEKLSDIINELIKSPEQKINLAHAARTTAMDHSWNNVGEEYRTYYHKYFKDQSSSSA